LLKSLAFAPAACLSELEELFAQQPVQPFKPLDEANSPIGEAIGIRPGRVAWVRDSKATSWDGVAGYWWEDAYTNQKAVDRMTTRVLLDVTGQKNEKQAWDALFRNFNERHKNGRSGYRPGEKIAIKINANQDRGPDWSNLVPTFRRPSEPVRQPRPAQNGVPSPHAVVALVDHMIHVAGVRGDDILLYDATGGRNIGQPIYARIRSNPDPQFQAVKFLVGTDYNLGGRLSAMVDSSSPVRFSKAGIPPAYLPEQVTGARYMINMALLRAHGMAGVTLTGKNHFGSVCFPNNGGWSPRLLHSEVMRTQTMGSYNALVDLIGHRHLGGKTMLYLFDALYTAAHNEGNVMRWKSLGDQWASSLLASQDPVALDSVGLDLLRNEPNATEVRGNADNYLHEASLAHRPPSGIVYNPDGSAPLTSLGVHEHWNNPVDRKYSRNLARKQGIELIASIAG
jgi:hypothetical protein